MLFRKDVDASCAYCTRGSSINDDQVICIRQGVVPATYHCSHFRYDPLRRVPPRPKLPDFSEFEDADFSLETPCETTSEL